MNSSDGAPSSPLPRWGRPFFEPGGGDPFLFYVVFGDFSALSGDAAGTAEIAAGMSRAVYRSEGPPPGVEVARYRRAEHPDWFAGFLGGQIGRLLDDELGASGAAAAVRAAPDCIALVGSIADPPTLDYLRDTVGVLTFLSDRGGAALLDAFGLRWWAPDAWRRAIFEPDEPAPLRHVEILVSEDAPGPNGGKTVWLHTRGMRTFGRPDLSVPGVGPAHVNGAIDLCNRFIVWQALGGVVPEGQLVSLPGLPAGTTCHHAGSVDDPNFNNRHLEIRWPGATPPPAGI